MGKVEIPVSRAMDDAIGEAMREYERESGDRGGREAPYAMVRFVVAHLTSSGLAGEAGDEAVRELLDWLEAGDEDLEGGGRTALLRKGGALYQNLLDRHYSNETAGTGSYWMAALVSTVPEVLEDPEIMRRALSEEMSALPCAVLEQTQDPDVFAAVAYKLYLIAPEFLAEIIRKAPAAVLTRIGPEDISEFCADGSRDLREAILFRLAEMTGVASPMETEMAA